MTDEEKFDAMAAADVLIMPSYFESLSMVTLEAWAIGLPVLVNGNCDVLRGQTIRANAGLYYENYEEFSEALHVLETHESLQRQFSRNGRAYFDEHYKWETIEQKYLSMFEQLKREDQTGIPRTIEQLPSWFSRYRRNQLPTRTVVDQLPSGPILTNSDG